MLDGRKLKLIYAWNPNLPANPHAQLAGLVLLLCFLVLICWKSKPHLIPCHLMSYWPLGGCWRGDFTFTLSPSQCPLPSQACEWTHIAGLSSWEDGVAKPYYTFPLNKFPSFSSYKICSLILTSLVQKGSQLQDTLLPECRIWIPVHEKSENIRAVLNNRITELLSWNIP